MWVRIRVTQLTRVGVSVCRLRFAIAMTELVLHLQNHSFVFHQHLFLFRIAIRLTTRPRVLPLIGAYVCKFKWSNLGGIDMPVFMRLMYITGYCKEDTNPNSLTLTVATTGDKRQTHKHDWWHYKNHGSEQKSTGPVKIKHDLCICYTKSWQKKTLKKGRV
jgi:hypothetical protein